MHYVYIIRSIGSPEQIYIGFTKDLRKRIDHHNTGASKHTSKYRPWELIIYHAFQEEDKAISFEKYLKSGSGRAFLKKRFL